MIKPIVHPLCPKAQATALRKQAEVYTELAMVYEQAAELLASGGELTKDLLAELQGESEGRETTGERS